MKKIIIPSDESLSLNAKGILSTMLNEPECDYITLLDLCNCFRNNSLNEISEAISELIEKEYLISLDNGKVAINKKSISDMTIL